MDSLMKHQFCICMSLMIFEGIDTQDVYHGRIHYICFTGSISPYGISQIRGHTQAMCILKTTPIKQVFAANFTHNLFTTKQVLVY